MNRRNKNITLIVILGILVLISLTLALTGRRDFNTLADKGIFQVQDTAKIDQISIKSKGHEISLKKNNDGIWALNDKYKAGQNIVKVLLAILKDVEVMRKVPKNHAGEIAEKIKNEGYLISVYGNDQLLESFYSLGNDTKTLSWFMQENGNFPMAVHIPGYQSYVAGIFEIPLNDWRDRLILSTNYRTLRSISVSYSQFPEHGFEIITGFDIPIVKDVQPLDTAKMMSYIEQFGYLQADRFIDHGQSGHYDSLANTPHTVTIAVKDIDEKNTKTLLFFPLLKDDPMMLGLIKEDDQLVLFSANRIQGLFAVKSDFIKRNSKNPPSKQKPEK